MDNVNCPDSLSIKRPTMPPISCRKAGSPCHREARSVPHTRLSFGLAGAWSPGAGGRAGRLTASTAPSSFLLGQRWTSPPLQPATRQHRPRTRITCPTPGATRLPPPVVKGSKDDRSGRGSAGPAAAARPAAAAAPKPVLVYLAAPKLAFCTAAALCAAGNTRRRAASHRAARFKAVQQSEDWERGACSECSSRRRARSLPGAAQSGAAAGAAGVRSEGGSEGVVYPPVGAAGSNIKQRRSKQRGRGWVIVR
jgi:hypothetical protein